MEDVTMNTSFGKVAVFVLAMLPVSSLAASGSALPISSLMELKEEKEFPSPVIVSGVLGYTPSCKLAIYSDPFAARSRDLSLGVQLADRPLEELFWTLCSCERRTKARQKWRLENRQPWHISCVSRAEMAGVAFLREKCRQVGECSRGLGPSEVIRWKCSLPIWDSGAF